MELPIGALAESWVGDLLIVVLTQFRFGVERVDVRHASGHIKKDHALGLCGKVRCFECERIARTTDLLGQQFREHSRQQQSTCC